MKKFVVIFISAFVGAIAVMAHTPGEHAAGSTGPFGLKSEYIHVLLNPLPVYGLALATLSLAAGLLTRSKKTQVIGLGLVFICAASAWPVLVYGQHGYDNIFQELDYESQAWLNEHMRRAEQLVYAFYITAILAIAALISFRKFARLATALSVVTLVASLASLGIGGWISRAGGEISHSEFRTEEIAHSPAEHSHSMHDTTEVTSNASVHEHHEPATTNKTAQTAQSTNPVKSVAHEHQPSQQTADQPQTNHQHSSEAEHNHTQPSPSATTTTNNAAPIHQHNHTNSTPNQSPHSETAHHSVAETNQTPVLPSHFTDTPERLWTQLHQHQSQLQEIITSKKFSQIHAHAVAIKQLTQALVAVVHPDHRATVQAGTENIIQSIGEVHAAAHADDEQAIKDNFKQFNAALMQLEDQMRKQ